MELYVFIILLSMTLVVLYFNLFETVTDNKCKKVYIKEREFLLMENNELDLGEKEQKIIVKHHYANSLKWIYKKEK